MGRLQSGFKKALKDFPRKRLLSFHDRGKPACFGNIKLKELGT